MRISAIVWGDSVCRLSPMDTCSSAGSDFLQTTCLVKDLASPKKLKGKGGGGFSLCPREPRAGSVPQTWPGAAHPPAGALPRGIQGQARRHPHPARHCHDHRPPSGGLGRTGTRVWEASRSQVWHTVSQAASSSDGGPAHAPGDLAAAPRALSSGTRPLGRGLAQGPGSAGRPASSGESRQAEPGLQWPWRDTCDLRHRASRVPSMADFSPEPWPGH